MTNYGKFYRPGSTPQSEPIPGSSQTMNNAGGFAWQVDKWGQLDRFLFLGSDGPTYYASQSKLARDNAKAVVECLASDGRRTVERIAEISLAGRAPKNDPAVFALALAATLGDTPTKRAAMLALPLVCRTATHLFQFANFLHPKEGAWRGWGRTLREGVANWYIGKPADDLAYQLIKYRNREGWSHYDLLSLSHPKAPTAEHNAVYKWVVSRHAYEAGWINAEEFVRQASDALLSTRFIQGFERLMQATSPKEARKIIEEYGLPHECIPTELKRDPGVWESLLMTPNALPLKALVRNLGVMTANELLGPGSAASREVVRRLGDEKALRRARLHPLAILLAEKVYSQGHGDKGKLVWRPVQDVVDALDESFYTAFGVIEPTNKRLVLGLDVSGSMTASTIAGAPGITPRDGAAAMALVTKATEKNAILMAFTDKFIPLNISPRMRLDTVVNYMNALDFGRTDCALPMQWALQNRVEADAFFVYTDNETWAGSQHPVEALREYRQRMSIPAKLIVVAMTSAGFTIADPKDGGCLDVVGFDAAAPTLINNFVADRLTVKSSSESGEEGDRNE